MVTLDQLSPGASFHDLTVQVYSLEGTKPSSNGSEPFYFALVRDDTAYAQLVYRASNNCKPSSVRKGKYYIISGKVTSFEGKLQLQIGSSWGKVIKINGHTFKRMIPYSPAFDISGFKKIHIPILVRKTKDIEYFVKSDRNSPFSEGNLSNYLENERQSAIRIFGENFELKADDFLLLQIPPQVFFVSISTDAIYYLHCATLFENVWLCSGEWRNIKNIKDALKTENNDSEYNEKAIMALGLLESTLKEAEKNGFLKISQTEEIESEDMNENKDKRLPVTLLSGFLGSGKTTLLKYILEQKEINLKCAIIVNDMAELNIDASLLKNTELIQSEEKLIEMQNGCICCTLRDDLLEEIRSLSSSGNFDYLIIESTGVSEPIQVAETFYLSPSDDSAPLSSVAVLDTCVTVLDALTMYENIFSIETLKEKEGEAQVDEEDDRNVADLMLDQIEFANVILLNKTDLLNEAELDRIEKSVKSLNPEAEIIKTQYCKVDLDKILYTKKFDLEKAKSAAGWLKILQSSAELKPETAEYGISHFLYRARKPFYPERLHAFFEKYFILHEQDWSDAIESEKIPNLTTENNSAKKSNLDIVKSQDTILVNLNATTDNKEDLESVILDKKIHKDPQNSCSSAVDCFKTRECMHNVEFEKTLENKRNLTENHLGVIFRSKGFSWVAGRDDHCAGWSQAGRIITFSTGGPWFCVLPREAWPTEPEEMAKIQRDFVGECGDRRQEIVFIGQNMNKEEIQSCLDECLCSEKEIEIRNFKDPFKIWPDIQDIMDAGDDKDSEKDSEEISEFESTSFAEEEKKSDIDQKIINQNCKDEKRFNENDIVKIYEGSVELNGWLQSLEINQKCYIFWYSSSHLKKGLINDIVEYLKSLKCSFAAIVDITYNTKHNMALANKQILGLNPKLKFGGLSKKAFTKLHSSTFPCVTVHRAPNIKPHEIIKGTYIFQEIKRMNKEVESVRYKSDKKILTKKEVYENLIQEHSKPIITTASANLNSQHFRYERSLKFLGDIDTGNVIEIKKGKADFKLTLETAREMGVPVIALWLVWNGKICNEARAEFEKLLPSVLEVYLIVIDKDSSDANAKLCEAMKLKYFPSLHYYEDMRLKKTANNTVASVIEKFIFKWSEERFTKAKSYKNQSINNKMNIALSETLEADKNLIKGDEIKKDDSPPKTNNVLRPITSSGNVLSTQYDPPAEKGKDIKRKFKNKGTASYWPKMPCLNCGCPWWLGEDWDAKCVRCSWNCEKDGYDNDSKPYPKYKDKYDSFIKILKAGKTPEYKE